MTFQASSVTYSFGVQKVICIGFSIGQVSCFCFALQSCFFFLLFRFVPFSFFLFLSSPFLHPFLFPSFPFFSFQKKSLHAKLGQNMDWSNKIMNSSLVVLQKEIARFHVFRHKNWCFPSSKNSRFTGCEGVNIPGFRLPDFSPLELGPCCRWDIMAVLGPKLWFATARWLQVGLGTEDFGGLG